MTLDIERLERSFAQVRGRDVEFTATFYRTLFSEHPEVKPLFRHTQMPEQGQKLFKSLVLIVESLRQPEKLNSSLKGLGTRHINYGVLPQHYPMVGNALLKTFEQLLNSDWTPAFQRAWLEAYRTVTQIMLEGANYSAEILTMSSKFGKALSSSEINTEIIMTTVTFHAQPVTLVGNQLDIGEHARDVRLTGVDLSPICPLDRSQGKARLFITLPSLDTEVCSLEAKKFSGTLKEIGESVAGYFVSADLPFAQKRWSQTEEVDNITLLSDYRDRDLARSWGLLVQELGLLARAVYVIDSAGVVTYREIVPELTSEPDYEAALASLHAVI